MDYKALGLTLVTDFISIEEEKSLLELIPRGPEIRTKHRNYVKRYGSDAPYKSSMVSKTIPEHFQALGEKLVKEGVLEGVPDSITVNEYLPGQTIPPHVDSAASGKVITVLSLLSEATMEFVKLSTKETFQFVLPPRSVVHMADEIRWKWNHAILPVPGLRYSIVFRDSRNLLS